MRVIWGSHSTVKKLFAIAFICVYLTLTVGVARTTHYCMGRVKSSTFFSFEPTACACSVMANWGGNSCCDNHSELIKIKDDQSITWVVSLTPDLFFIGPSFSERVEQFSKANQNLLRLDIRPPPDPVPLFRRHCAFVFYEDQPIA